jgi:hypothetical protein
VPPDINSCKSTGFDNVTITGASGLNISFVWVDTAKITTWDGKLVFVAPKTDPTLFALQEKNSCVDTIFATQANGVGTDRGELSIASDGGFSGGSSDHDLGDAINSYKAYLGNANKIGGETKVGSCYIQKYGINLGNTAAAKNASGTGTIPGGGLGSTTTAGDSCESQGGALGWILCPITKLIDSALSWVDEQIQALLEIDSTAYTNNGLETAWSQIRNIAYIILVPIMLVMVIGTALGWSFIDAYTVRRALPRLLIAVLFITLSWTITTFLIGFSNTIGHGVIGLLTAPFRSNPPLSELTLSGLYGGSVIQTLLAPGFAIGVIVALWLFGGTLLLFAGIAFLVLLLRQLFIVGLILVAPLAILAWIFPNNDRLWKSWWGLFSKLLMMFPLIMGLIAVGRIFAFIINQDGAGNAGLQGAVIKPLAILIVWMLPYAFIPLTFAFAGGVFGTLTGAISNRGKGLFDRQKQGRAAKLERTAGGKMFKGAPATGLRSRLNTAAGGVMHAKRAGVNPLLWRARMGSGATDTQRKAVETMMQDKENGFQKDDDLSRAASESGDASQLREILRTRLAARYTDQNGNLDRNAMEKDVARVEAMRRKYGNKTFQVASWQQALAGGTAWSEEEGAAAPWEAAGHIAGGDRALLSDMVGQKGLAVNAGRIEHGGGSFGDTMAVAMGRGNGTMTREDADRRLLGSVIDSSPISTVVYGKPQSARALGRAHQARIQSYIDSLSSGTAIRIGDETRIATDRDIKQSLASADGIHDAMQSAAPQQARAFADTLMGSGLVVSGLSAEARAALGPAFASEGVGVTSLGPEGNLTVRQVMDGLAGRDQQYMEMRRDYASGTASEIERLRGGAGTPGPGGTPTPTPDTGAPGPGLT